MTTLEQLIPATPRHYIRRELEHIGRLYHQYCLDVHHTPTRNWWMENIYQKNGYDKEFKRLYIHVYGEIKTKDI